MTNAAPIQIYWEIIRNGNHGSINIIQIKGPVDCVHPKQETMEAGVTWTGWRVIVCVKGCMSSMLRMALLAGLIIPQIFCTSLEQLIDGHEQKIMEQQQKVQLGRSVAWNQLEQHVRKGHLDSFKGDLGRYVTAGLLQDRDSGYYEVLQAILTRRPRELCHQMLQPFFRSMCSKSIIQLLPDLLEEFDLDGLLLLRKYCPVGGSSIEGLLEMYPHAHEGNPLTRYLLENWEDPLALEFSRNPFKLDLVFSDMKGPSDQHKPEQKEGRDMFLRLDKHTLHYRYHNLIIFSEGMHRDHLLEVMVPLLKMLESDVDAKAKLHRLSTWMDRYPGSLSMALMADGKVHLWQRGSGSFIAIAVDDVQEVETALYPLGNGFKNPSNTLKYTTVDVPNGALLAYVSSAVVDRIHIHDLVGSLLYSTDEAATMKATLKDFYERIVCVRLPGGDAESATGIFFRVFQVQAIDRQRQVTTSKPPERRRFRFADSTFAAGSSRDSGESDISLGPRIHAHHRRRQSGRSDPLVSLLNESEASFDDNDCLASSSEDGLEETLFERRRWWSLGASETQSETHGYDSSMSRDFFYRPETQDESMYTHYSNYGTQSNAELFE